MKNTKDEGKNVKSLRQEDEDFSFLDQLFLTQKPNKALKKAAKGYKKSEEYKKRKHILNNILTYTWDPLHTTALRLYDKAELTEYEGYIDLLLEFVDSGAKIEELAEILACIVEQYMEDYVLADREFRAAELIHEVR